jgi:beta-N-acetylhexosaminidase
LHKPSVSERTGELRRLAQGVIITGFAGFELDASLRKQFASADFAGYVLFASNVDSLEQVRALTDSLRSLTSTPPIVGIDQEGGRVARLRDGVEALPSMMACGATGNPSIVQRAGEQVGSDLRRAGCTLDFAPVVDLAVDPMNTVIGTRAFGASPDVVIPMARAFIGGLSSAGITPTLKHFPGHGATAVDSHLGLPYVDVDERTLRSRDLAPFRACATSDVAIMTAHVVARAIDPDRPATISPLLLTGVLRDEWHWDGVCFTDCMQMDAIAKGIGTIPGVIAAIAAGADCATISHDIDLALAAANALADAVERGTLSFERLNEAHARVMRLRELAQPALPLDTPSPHPGIGREIARRAATLVRGIAHADPTASIAVSFQSETREGVVGVHAQHASLTSQAPVLHEVIAPLDPSDAQTSDLLAQLAASQRRPIVLARRAHVYPAQARAIAAIVARDPDALVVSVREPFDVPLFASARHVVAMFDDSAPSIGALADVLFGAGSTRGHLPVEI